MNHGSSTNIGPTTKVTGRLSGEGDLAVEGRVEGELSLKGNLLVVAGGVVEAPVQADDVTVEGSIDGDITARGAVSLRAGGQVRGAIKADRVALEEGARFAGQIDMDVELPEELAPKRR